MTMKYIRANYNVPAKRGASVQFTDTYGSTWTGKIVSSRGPYIRVRQDNNGRVLTLHPTWNVKY